MNTDINIKRDGTATVIDECKCEHMPDGMLCLFCSAVAKERSTSVEDWR